MEVIFNESQSQSNEEMLLLEVSDAKKHQTNDQKNLIYSKGGSLLTKSVFPDMLPSSIVASPLYSTLFSAPPPVWLVKAIKFYTVVFTLTSLSHWYIRWVDFENDESYKLSTLLKYDFTPILMDLLLFFTVGRLARKQGIDTLEFVVPSILGIYVMSKSSDWSWARYSVSLYMIHCRWPLTLMVVSVFVLALGIFIVSAHFRFALQKGILVAKMLEMTTFFILLLAPVASNPNLHLHHWFCALLLAPHANFDIWWSRATFAFLMGMYINGISVYGRDPVLGCDYGYYLSLDQSCSYFECNYYTDDDGNSTDDGPIPLPESDWRNCSSPAP